MTSIQKRRFKLATTSFIVPDHIIPNVEKLGPYFDEIELLVFESMPEDVIPSKDEVKRLLELSQEYNLSYNIHLPIDINPTDTAPEKRRQACDTLIKIKQRFASLPISTHTLHLPMSRAVWSDPGSRDRIHQWQEDAFSGMNMLLSSGIDISDISIETLEYPFEHVEPLIDTLDLGVCLDAGHLIKYGYDVERTFDTHHQKIPLIHLHGVDMTDPQKKDHLALDRLPVKILEKLMQKLGAYEGVVSLELFHKDKLIPSLAVLSNWFYPVPHISF